VRHRGHARLNTAVLVGVECVFVVVDIGEQVGVFLSADGGAIEALFDGVAVAGQPPSCTAELGAFDSVVFAGCAGGRGGGAGCHNGASFMRHYTRPGVAKKAAGCKGQVAAGGTAVC